LHHSDPKFGGAVKTNDNQLHLPLMSFWTPFVSFLGCLLILFVSLRCHNKPPESFLSFSFSSDLPGWKNGKKRCEPMFQDEKNPEETRKEERRRGLMFSDIYFFSFLEATSQSGSRGRHHRSATRSSKPLGLEPERRRAGLLWGRRWAWVSSEKRVRLVRASPSCRPSAGPREPGDFCLLLKTVTQFSCMCFSPENGCRRKEGRKVRSRRIFPHGSLADWCTKIVLFLRSRCHHRRQTHPPKKQRCRFFQCIPPSGNNNININNNNNNNKKTQTFWVTLFFTFDELSYGIWALKWWYCSRDSVSRFSKRPYSLMNIEKCVDMWNFGKFIGGRELRECLGIAHPAKKKMVWHWHERPGNRSEKKRERRRRRRRKNESGRVHFDLLLEVCQSFHRVLRGFCCLIHFGVGHHGFDGIVRNQTQHHNYELLVMIKREREVKTRRRK